MKIIEFKEAEIISLTAPTKEELRIKVEEFCEKHKQGYRINLNKIIKSSDGQYTITIQIRKVIEKYVNKGSGIPLPPKGEFEFPNQEDFQI